MITAAVSSFHLTEIIPGREIACIAQSRAAQRGQKKKRK
jgi:hypothetical protein